MGVPIQSPQDTVGRSSVSELTIDDLPQAGVKVLDDGGKPISPTEKNRPQINALKIPRFNLVGYFFKYKNVFKNPSGPKKRKVAIFVAIRKVCVLQRKHVHKFKVHEKWDIFRFDCAIRMQMR
jgi:hypothetical protein